MTLKRILASPLRWWNHLQKYKMKISNHTLLSTNINQCPACRSKTFEGHDWYNFAQVPYHEEAQAQIDHLEKLFNERNWVALKGLWTGDIRSDDLLEVILLRCPDHQITALEYISRIELWEPDYLKSHLILTSEESSGLEALTSSENWRKV